MSDWILILGVVAATYYALRCALRAVDRAREILGETLAREPIYTVTRSVCAWCKRVLGEERERYDPERGGLEITHGICAACLEEHYPRSRPWVDVDLDDAPRVLESLISVRCGEGGRS